MTKTCCASPGYCMLSCFCAPCVICHQRKKIIGEDGEYRCCLGFFPCCDYKCAPCCLFFEAFCCCGLAASANRIYVMQRLNIKTDPCDEYIICCSNVMMVLSCCIRCFTDNDRLANCCQYTADLLFCTTLACMQTQVNYEIKNNKLTQGEWPQLGKPLPIMEAAKPDAEEGKKEDEAEAPQVEMQ
mmetsp:Transcript_21034/g.42326  ORF Transcript_21034/g.42326 Transcript_21034/m.42326 type:complete len:185 (+) Transcript_21034:190-744(+)